MAIFLTRGQQLSIPAGGLQIRLDENGQFHMSVRPQLSVTLYPHWLEIAFSHLQLAKEHRERLEAAHAANDNTLKARALEAEFAHSMQAILAAVTAIEAFYSAFKHHAKFSAQEMRDLNESRASRAKHVKEAIRRSFRLKDEFIGFLDEVLTALYKFRDNAVHPPTRRTDPVYHEVIDSEVEWRFVDFSVTNAQLAVRHAMSLIHRLLVLGAASALPVKDQCSQSVALVEPAVKQWEKAFGSLMGPS